MMKEKIRIIDATQNNLKHISVEIPKHQKCLNDPGVINYVAYEPGQWSWLYYGASGLYDLRVSWQMIESSNTLLVRLPGRT